MKYLSTKYLSTKYLFLTAVLIFSYSANAAELKSKEDVKKFVQSTEALVGAGEILKAFEGFKPYLIIQESEFQVTVDQYKLQQPIMEQHFGKTIGAEPISFKEQGESLLLATFIQKFEKHVMRWRIFFYKPKDQWLIRTYATDDKIYEIFTD